MPLKIGVIGAGDWGKNHLRIYSELPCELIGLADINPQVKSLADQHHVKFFTSYKELLPLVDAVSVVVPTDLHYEVVKDCLDAGKHVLVEKPITTSYKDSKELIGLAKKNRKLLAVGYLFRFNAAVKKVKEALPSLGNIHYITARFIHSNKPPRKDSGAIFNFGIHLVDILTFILDRQPKKVFCQKMHYLSEEREDAASITLDYGSFFANLEMSWLHPSKQRDLWIVGEKATLYADLFEQIVIKYPLEISYTEVKRSPEVNLEVNKNEPLKEEIRAFLEEIQNPSYGKFDGAEELLTTKICEMALKSANEGKQIEL